MADRNRSGSQGNDSQRFSDDADGAMRGRSDTGVRSNAPSNSDGRERYSSTRYDDSPCRDSQRTSMDRSEPRYSDRSESSREYQRNDRRNEQSYRDDRNDRDDRGVQGGRRYQGNDERLSRSRNDSDDSYVRRDYYRDGDNGRDRSDGTLDRNNGRDDRASQYRPSSSNADRYDDRYDNRNSGDNGRSSGRARYEDDRGAQTQYRSDRYESGQGRSRGPRDNVAQPRESYRSSGDDRSGNSDYRDSDRGQWTSDGRDSLTDYNNVGGNVNLSRGDVTNGNRNTR
jgi:hypothetical protein